MRTHRGTQRISNVDNDILFWAGVLAGRGEYEVVVVASGDGELGCDLARNLRDLPGVRTILTLRLAGSTSNRLNVARNANIGGNIEIGLDCLAPRRR